MVLFLRLLCSLVLAVLLGGTNLWLLLVATDAPLYLRAVFVAGIVGPILLVAYYLKACWVGAVP